MKNLFTSYSGIGFTPIPFKPQSKEPTIPWKAYQTSKPSVATLQLWDKTHTSIGFVTGENHGFFVLDIDGEEGVNTINELASKYGYLPPTVSSITGNGYHYYFKYPSNVKITCVNRKFPNGEILPGIDIRGDGGLIIAPPSIHPNGSQYKWLNSPFEHPIADAPQWLLDKFIKLTTPPNTNATMNQNLKSDAYLKKAVDDEINNLLNTCEGERNHQLNKCAFALGQLAKQGYDSNTAKSQLNFAALRIGLEQKEITRTINSGFNSGYNSPRQESYKNNPFVTNDAIVTQGIPDLSLINRKEIKPLPFPLDCFSDDLQDWMRVASKCKNAPVDYIALSLLVSCAGVIGNTIAFQPWEGWIEPCILWGVLVGNPSSSKSPAIDSVIDSVFNIEKDAQLLNSRNMELYEEQKKVYEIKKNEWKTLVKSAIHDKTQVPPAPVSEIALPLIKHYILTDATIEKISDILSKNNRGIILYKDELSGLLANFQKYGGNDKQFYLEGFGGRSYKVERVKNPKGIFVPRLSISLLGGIQPDVLSSNLLNGDDDGFASRFLYSWPETKQFTKPNISYNQQYINNALKKLSLLDPLQDGKHHMGNQVILKFQETAGNILAEWIQKNQQLENESNGLMISFLGKCRGLVVRLSGILTYLDWSFSHNNEPKPNCIKAPAVERAIELMDLYYIPMARRCFGDACFPQDQKDAIAIAKWIYKNKPSTINSRELGRGQGSPVKNSTRIDKAIDVLVNANWLIYSGGRIGDTRGRERKDYIVNPLVFSMSGDKSVNSDNSSVG